METNYSNTSPLIPVDPPRLEGQLDALYYAIKQVQAYCLAINLVPDMAWKDFMVVYRNSQTAYNNQALEDLLKGENQQAQLRAYTAEYLDDFSMRLLLSFTQITRFSRLYTNCFDELYRTISVRMEKGFEEPNDYSLVIGLLVKNAKEYSTEIKQLDSDLCLFFKKLQSSYEALSFIKEEAENFFVAEKERIKKLEEELSCLNKQLDNENNTLIRRSCLMKEKIDFVMFTQGDASSNQILAIDTKEENKIAKELAVKIARLKEALSQYDRDYARLTEMVSYLDKLRHYFSSVITDIRAIGYSWDTLEQLFNTIKAVLDNPDLSKDAILNDLLPFISTLKAFFLEISDIISGFNKILPITVTVLKEENQQVVKHYQREIFDSELLAIYLH